MLGPYLILHGHEGRKTQWQLLPQGGDGGMKKLRRALDGDQASLKSLVLR